MLGISKCKRYTIQERDTKTQNVSENKNTSILHQWRCLPDGVEIVWTPPVAFIELIQSTRIHEALRREEILNAELVNTRDSAFRIRKGVRLILNVEVQNILSTIIKTSSAYRPLLMGGRQDEVFNYFTGVGGGLSGKQRNLLSPSEILAEGAGNNEVVFSTLESVNTYAGMHPTSRVQVKSIIYDDTVDAHDVYLITRCNPQITVEHIDAFLGGNLRQRRNDWVDQPDKRFIFLMSNSATPSRPHESRNSHLHRFMNYVPAENIISLPCINQHDVWGQKFVKYTGKKIFAALNKSCHLTIVAHGDDEGISRVHTTHRLTMAYGIRDPEKFADFLIRHGLKEIGVLFINSCLSGESMFFNGLGEIMKRKGVRFGLLVGVKGLGNADDGTIKDVVEGYVTRKRIIPRDRAYNVVRGNLPADPDCIHYWLYQ